MAGLKQLNCRTVGLDQLQQAYGRVLLGRRICQLYCFMLLFEPMTKLISLGYQIAAWMIITGLSQIVPMPSETPVSLDSLETSRSLFDLLFVANIGFIFYIYSAFRPAWWIIPLCVIALGYNQYMAYVGVMLDVTNWPVIIGRKVDTEVAIQSWLFQGGIAFSHIYFLYVAVRGQKAIHSLNSDERQILSELRPYEQKFAVAGRMLVNIPGAVRYASGRFFSATLMVLAGVSNFLNYWRLTVVFIFLCSLPILSAALVPDAMPALRALVAGEQTKAAMTTLGVGMILILIMFAIMLTIPWTVKKVGLLAVRLAEKNMQTSLEKIQHVDQRPPILFLRSFTNDRVPLPAGDFDLGRWLLDGAGSADTLDYMMLDEGTKTGPTVALGNPDDPAPPYGVARGYFDHDDWQEAVSKLCEDSAAIIFVMDETEGVRWELKHIAGQEFQDKTLFLLAPDDVGQEQGRNLLSRALSRVAEIDRHEADELLINQTTVVLGFTMKQGTVELLCTTSVSKYTYLVMVRRFFALYRTFEQDRVSREE